MSGGLPTVLLVEDSPDDRFLIERAIRRAPMAVALQHVADGDAALAYLGGHDAYADRLRFPLPGLVLLDWKLARRSGREVLEWVRARPDFANLPVVVLTASSEEEDIRQAFAARATAYLQKPGDSTRFAAVIAHTLEAWLGGDAPAGPHGAASGT